MSAPTTTAAVTPHSHLLHHALTTHAIWNTCQKSHCSTDQPSFSCEESSFLYKTDHELVIHTHEL